MDSLYGGQPGSPFIIRKNFSTKSEMEEKFKQGIKYTDILYGEYCLIDGTGEIYRRSFTGSEYIGKINSSEGGSSGNSIYDFEELTLIRNVLSYDNLKHSTTWSNEYWS